MPLARKPVTLAGSALIHSCHACTFFHNKEAEYAVPATPPASVA